METNKIFDGVEDTLYIPLAARIYASENFSYFFYDQKALDLKSVLPLEKINSVTSEYFYMASVCRQQTLDKKIIAFLKKNAKANVVYLGAGLETSYNRINNKAVNFYQVDLENVIVLRKKLLNNGDNETLIACDIFSLAFVEKIDHTIPTLFVASGVFQYFNKDKIINFIKKLKNRFLDGEIIFDVTGSRGLKIANKYVERTGNKNAKMHFFIDNPYLFENETNTNLISVDGFFKDALKTCKDLKQKTRMYMYFADKLKRTKVIHLKFN